MSWGSGPAPSWRDDFTGPQLPDPDPVDDLSRFVMDQIRAAETEPRHEVPQAYDQPAGPIAHRYAAAVRRDMIAFRRILDLYCQEAWNTNEDGFQHGAQRYAEAAVLAIASRFADHPDMRDEWRLE